MALGPKTYSDALPAGSKPGIRLAEQIGPAQGHPSPIHLSEMTRRRPCQQVNRILKIHKPGLYPMSRRKGRGTLHSDNRYSQRQAMFSRSNPKSLHLCSGSQKNCPSSLTHLKVEPRMETILFLDDRLCDRHQLPNSLASPLKKCAPMAISP